MGNNVLREVGKKPAQFLPFASDVLDLSFLFEFHSHQAPIVKKPEDHECNKKIRINHC